MELALLTVPVAVTSPYKCRAQSPGSKDTWQQWDGKMPHLGVLGLGPHLLWEPGSSLPP